MPKPWVPPLDSYALVIQVPENSLCCSWWLAWQFGSPLPWWRSESSCQMIVMSRKMAMIWLIMMRIAVPLRMHILYLMVLRNATYWRSKRVEWIEKSGGAQIVLYRGGLGFNCQPSTSSVAFRCRMDARSTKRGWPRWNDLCIPERCRTWDAWQVWTEAKGGKTVIPIMGTDGQKIRHHLGCVFFF